MPGDQADHQQNHEARDSQPPATEIEPTAVTARAVSTVFNVAAQTAWLPLHMLLPLP